MAKSRVEMAREAAYALVDALELQNKPILECLMIAQRLARLERDEDAQRWLELETRGYPAELAPGHLGWCGKYALRFAAGNKVTSRNSLPTMEVNVLVTKDQFDSLRSNHVATGEPIDNFTVASATKEVLAARVRLMQQARDAHTLAVTQFTRMKASLHSYAVDSLIALELGDEAEDIFEAARTDVDAFIREHCPSAAQQLIAASERLRDDTAEGLSHALTSCRRLINNVADAVFPPQSEPYTDGRGKARKAGPDEYKNRLLAFIETRVTSGSTRSILQAQVNELAARVDSVNDKACKGVHDTVTPEEARLVVIHTYLLVAEVARLAKSSAAVVEAATGTNDDAAALAGRATGPTSESTTT
jgi:hypothetical protein